MPAANLAQRQQNLARLCDAHSAHCVCGAARAHASSTMAQKLPLSHAAPEGAMGKILGSGALLSQMAVNPRPDSAEATLGTADDVFFYLGAFGYPYTDCGFLFLPALEEGHQRDGVSTPFDSGALVSKVSNVNPPASYAQDIPGRVGFVRDHELPVSGYRELLSRVITDYSRACGIYLESPDEFKCECGFVRGHPFGLVGGDRRAATFEVRLPRSVPLSPPHLHAVFVRTGFEPRELAPLRRAGVRIETFQPEPGADSSGALRAACINFIQEHLLS
ncbi:hypothetical protein [Prosthecobacter fluviatilis]|uniref:Uncharacterized protein n=1 Tax=Prosthecobacter fluviatilis TaxID=445931 RepID=A0ABW0KX58_9BACT